MPTDLSNPVESINAERDQRTAKKQARIQQRELEAERLARETAARAADKIVTAQLRIANTAARNNLPTASAVTALSAQPATHPQATDQPFCILHVQKHKTRAGLVRILRHQFREIPVRNADSAQAHLNVRVGASGSADEVAQRVYAATDPLVKRKDAVRAVELMLTASPEFFSRHGGSGTSKQLWQSAQAFVRSTFGPENIIAMGLHRDETSPHVWCILTPVTDGKLCAAYWLDGPKKMAALQDGWASEMAHLGCQRGAKKSAATHTAIKTYYGAVNGDKKAQATIAREASRRARRAKKLTEEAAIQVAESQTALNRKIQKLEADRSELERREKILLTKARETHDLQKQNAGEKDRLNALLQALPLYERDQVEAFATRMQARPLASDPSKQATVSAPKSRAVGPRFP